MNGSRENGIHDVDMLPPPASDLPPPPPMSDIPSPPSGYASTGFEDAFPPPPPPSYLPAPPPPSSDLPPPPPPAETESILTDAYIAPPRYFGPAFRGVKNRAPAPPKPKKPLPPTLDQLLGAQRTGSQVTYAHERPKKIPLGSRPRHPVEPPVRWYVETSGATPSETEPVEDAKKSARNGTGRIPTEPAAMRNGNGDNSKKRKLSEEDFAKEPPNNFAGDVGSFANDPEYEQIKLRYMGKDPFVSTFIADKRRKRLAEKKFNFDWNVEDDTTQSTNPIYQYYKEPVTLRGVRRGGFTDIDAREADRQYAEMLKSVDEHTGAQRAAAYLERQERNRKAASRFDLSKHWADKELGEMTERDWRILKDDFNISIRGGVKVPNPIRYWAESGLGKEVLEVVDQVGYQEPTPVQRACIPIALQQRDLIGVAVTGSGKTAAFLLPLLVYIKDLPPVNKFNYELGPYAIILAPTRELAQQIEQETNKFAQPLGYKCMSLVGGHRVEEQSYKLQEGAEIIIATPGRLLDCIERRVLVLSQCCYIVMDEADRMIDMGFEEPVNKILAALPVQNEKPEDGSTDTSALRSTSAHIHGRTLYRQTMMYTATMPTALEHIARNYLRKPAIINIGNVGEAVDTVDQRVEFVGGEDKRMRRIEQILQSGEFSPPVIVFVNAKAFCEAVARDIKKMGFKVATLHGSKTQEQREQALDELRTGKAEILVATDLAGRGLDVNDVSLVLQYNMAPSIEAYTHRIGRTGRAGKTGVAISFLGSEDNDLLYDLKQMISNSPVSKVPDELKKHESAASKFGKGRMREVIE